MSEQNLIRPRGKAPQFHDDPAVDRLWAVVTALAGEVATLRDRLDAHERLAEKTGAYSRADVDAYEPTPEIDAERGKWREAYLSRVYRVMLDDA